MGKSYKENKYRRPEKNGKVSGKPFKNQGKQNNQKPQKWKFSEQEEADIYDDMKL